MRLIVHDLTAAQTAGWLDQENAGQDSEILNDDGTMRHCVGCFGCWVRTPGTCVLKDNYRHLGRRLADCGELVLVSRNVYGSYSPFVANALNRTLSYVLPYFAVRNGETHHARRYETRFRFTVHFYAEDMTADEIAAARALVQANAVNMGATDTSILFYDRIEDLREAWA
ncbi:flavodoxin family protein [Paenibacillus spiritus]|uniref:Flavodoxin family protein n=1 Tax=Paenibacillus spiritus TaxID=2496557 RepID=A0A5J5GK85_9BACL|nr:flavodoxin family protein [Paenibacillus spiritus]KAA9008615.1 flavodoxin family protein [Paenibacillus spiritus]